MKYELIFTDSAMKKLESYKKSNPTAFKKIIRLMPELESHPRIGTGHPEPLIKGNNITYSHRITAKDRLIYNIYDTTLTVIIIAVGGHYDDK